MIRLVCQHLLLVLLSLSAFSAAESSEFQCKFTVQNYSYDLCPLIQRADELQVTKDIDTPPTHTKNTYRIGLGGPLRRNGELPPAEQCPEGTWICLSVTNTRPDHPSEPTRILQVVPVAAADGLRPTATIDHSNDIPFLVVTLNGGSYLDEAQRARFRFHCDRKADLTKPEFFWTFNGTHTFSWKTKHACGSVSATPAPTPPKDTDSEPGPSKERESEGGETELIYHPRSSYRIYFILLMLSILCLFLLHFVFPQYSRRLLSYILSPLPKFTSKSMRFRPSPARLLLWARQAGMQEDEVDLMVNYEMDDGDGEEIPLTPNPRGMSRGTWSSKGEPSPGLYGSFANR
ncbi:autophagy-related protein 27-domain-containing protein [Mycena floridula]|nr:autophagy-related protein 27-domain-containing protein [Mycena floridula]